MVRLVLPHGCSFCSAANPNYLRTSPEIGDDARRLYEKEMGFVALFVALIGVVQVALKSLLDLNREAVS